jgi:hypothetical protein
MCLLELWLVAHDFGIDVDGAVHLEFDIEHLPLLSQCPYPKDARLKGLAYLDYVPVGLKHDLIHVPDEGCEPLVLRSLMLASNHPLVVLHYLPDLPPVGLLVLQPLAEVIIRRGTLFDFGVLGFGIFLRGLNRCQLLLLLKSLSHNGVSMVEILDVTEDVGCRLFLGCHLEEVFHVFLLELVILSLDPLVEPVRVLNPRHRVHALLESSWDGDNLHDGAGDTLLVVVPVDEGAHVEISDALVLEPPAQEFLPGRFVRLKDSRGDRTFGYLGIEGLLGYYELYIEALVLDDFGANELGETFGARNGCAFLLIVLLEIPGEEARLTNVLDQFGIIDVLALGLEDVVPFFSDLSAGIVAFLEGLAFQEFPEHFLLEDFDDFELTAAFKLETLDFMKFSRMREHSISLLEHLPLLFGGGYDHAAIGSIDLEEYRHLCALFILQCRLVN